MASAAQSYARLIAHTKETAVLDSCASLLAWDERTYMPSGGAEHRAEQHALLAGMSHERFTRPEIGKWLADIEGTDLVGDPVSAEHVNVREIRRAYDRQVKLPRALVEALARVTTLAEQAWQTDDSVLHRHGMRFRPGDLVQEVTGEPLSPRYLLDHLRSKFGALYGL